MASIPITSTEHWVNTGIMIKANKRSPLVATGEWKDASIVTDAKGYSSVNLLQRQTENLRRMPGAPWFALIGALDRREDTQFVIGAELVYSATEGGELTCFANDLVGFYFNNHGSITLSATELP